MRAADILDALQLPAACLVGRRVPKKLLADEGAPTAGDKRQIQDGVEELSWIAALKPTNVGVPVFRDEFREYPEIAVLHVRFRTERAARLLELVHRAIPYPVLLIAEQMDGVTVSLGHKRHAENEAGKVVLEELRKTALLNSNPASPEESEFLANLRLSTLPLRDMYALYQGWMDRVTAFEAASLTGIYAPATNPARSVEVRESLDNHARLSRELALLRAQAKVESQLNRRVELNLQIKKIEQEMAAVIGVLRSG